MIRLGFYLLLARSHGCLTIQNLINLLLKRPPPLSPAAQAVLDAFDRCGDNWPQALAAALYAAAHRLSHDRRQLAAIATELEGHHV